MFIVTTRDDELRQEFHAMLTIWLHCTLGRGEPNATSLL